MIPEGFGFQIGNEAHDLLLLWRPGLQNWRGKTNRRLPELTEPSPLSYPSAVGRAMKKIGGLVGVVFAAMVLTLPLIALHNVYGIGSAQLPAPQAGLRALMAQGIVNHEMAWDW